MRLIDADALTAHLLDVWYVDDEVYVGIIIEEISHAQTIEPSMPTLEERKTGHWITKSTNGEMFDCCSVCGYVEWDEPKNYCPNCGADMRGEQHEAD